jgi:hypothetical protein
MAQKVLKNHNLYTDFAPIVPGEADWTDFHGFFRKICIGQITGEKNRFWRMGCQWRFGGINPCLSSWKSVETDSATSPKGFHVLSRRLQPRQTMKVFHHLPDHYRFFRKIRENPFSPCNLCTEGFDSS